MRPSRRVRLNSGDIFRLVIFLVLFAAVLLVALATDLFDEVTPGLIHGWVRRAGVWTPVAYLVGFVVRPLILVPLTLWLLAGGLAFGWLWGAVYALAGVNLGAAAGFLAARGLGRELVEKVLMRRAGGWRRQPKVWNARFVLSLQLLPFMPHDLLNAAAGCSKMSYWRFLLGSALGTLPAILFCTYAGSVLMAPGSKRFYAAFAAICALALASLAALRWLRPAEEEEEEGKGVEHGEHARLEPSARGGD